MKYYAKQVNPEYQESPFEFECWPNIAFFSDFYGGNHIPESMQKAAAAFEDDYIRDYIDDLRHGVEYFSSFQDLFAEYIPCDTVLSDDDCEKLCKLREASTMQ